MAALTIGNGFDEWFEVQHKGKEEGKVHLRCEWKPVKSDIPEPEHEQKHLQDLKILQPKEKIEEQITEPVSEEPSEPVVEEPTEPVVEVEEPIVEEVKEEPTPEVVPEPTPEAVAEDSLDEELVEIDEAHQRRQAALKSLISILGRPVAIKSHLGKYLRIKSHPIIKFDSDTVGPHEQWVIFPLDDG